MASPAPETTSPPPESYEQDEGIVALSVKDDCGVTVAVYKPNSEAIRWQTISSNLIAYWAGDGGSIQLYFDAVAKALARKERTTINLEMLVSYNQNSGDILPIDGWTSGAVMIHVRDRLNLYPPNLLKMVISRKSIAMELIEDCETAIGTYAPAAVEVLNNASSIIASEVFEDDEKLREHIVSKAIVDALPNSYNTGCCEILRGSPEKAWRTVGAISVEELRSLYDTGMTPIKEELQWSDVIDLCGV